ncbi:DNA repair protein RecN [Streptococcus pseudoporcinus]|uniref:DNA repair protein RecN n=1 Tax=Streptococcus pseudoporcinus TaxID=361101 RepID=A0A4U9XJ10_9STRE|nr:DNA repair protein RecN [Streptococcus pseudoporcinus]VTS12765.1 DNA repair protein recN [Streptococcus pseudoporcinus]VUC65561.1 DNA repair protein recN [Streptococcus pseudoporcinus]VUC96482.1 DNA repair protein recN [Streptococcus pseudoporcinus]VUC96873.1 DNA repair protein recN [Streptococcus pseudoporcinus]
MLLEISIKNFAIIEEISLSFDNGMTVLTGETGAGKSIIIDAMNMMLGARASIDVIRHGAQKAEIEGFFSIDHKAELMTLLEANGIDVQDELIIRRDIFANGRSVSRINGQMVNLSTLKEVGQFLVDIHGQHDQEELMRSAHHLAILDAFGDSSFQNQKVTYQETFEAYKSLREKVIEKQKNARDHKERIDMLAFQMAEIEAVDLQKGEDISIQSERQRLLNHKQIADTLVNAAVLIDNEELSSLSNIRSAMNDLLTIENFDPDYQLMARNITEAYYILEDVNKMLSDTVDNLDFDAGRLLELDSRLDQINSLTRKYGGNVDDLLDYYSNIEKEYQLLTGSESSDEELESQLKRVEKDLIAQAKLLSHSRHKLANQLELDIKHQLNDLYMAKANFEVRLTPSKFSRNGNETVEFYISTNPGEGFKPLVKVASGGELSRLMLAIKAAISSKEDKTSIVFDEVDTGVSGRVAQAIAQKIYKIGKNSQVLAISHLPQVIAIADYQYYISKESKADTTISRASLLEYNQRVEEIAKMIAGNDITETARQQARDLLQKK